MHSFGLAYVWGKAGVKKKKKKRILLKGISLEYIEGFKLSSV